MGDYDYLGSTPPPRRTDDTDTNAASTMGSVNANSTVVNNSAPAPITTPMLFADGSQGAVTLHPDLPNPLGGSGPAVIIHAPPGSAQPKGFDPSKGNPGNSQVVTGQNAQGVSPGTQSAPIFGIDAQSDFSNQAPANIYAPPPAPGYVAGNAPDPSVYAAKGEDVHALLSDPYSLYAAGPYMAGQLAQFHAGGPLDAQHYGSDRAYGNYTYGVFNAATGTGLPEALNGADLYGQGFSHYGEDIKMDPVYTHIPQDNVQNITRGYNDYMSGTLWHKPK